MQRQLKSLSQRDVIIAAIPKDIDSELCAFKEQRFSQKHAQGLLVESVGVCLCAPGEMTDHW